MPTTKERTEMREKLVEQGYSWEYIDGWQPKITLYRHAPIISQDGNVVSPVGQKVGNLPGNPNYVLRKSIIGMLPYPPSNACECRWCVANSVDVEIPEEPKKAEPQESILCQTCGEEVFALTKAGALSRLRVHTKTHEGAE